MAQGAEQAINSMRIQVLIGLAQFSNIGIFATNLVKNDDETFDTRVGHATFALLNEQVRARIWKRLLVRELPGRDIRNRRTLSAQQPGNDPDAADKRPTGCHPCEQPAGRTHRDLATHPVRQSEVPLACTPGTRRATCETGTYCERFER